MKYFNFSEDVFDIVLVKKGAKCFLFLYKSTCYVVFINPEKLKGGRDIIFHWNFIDRSYITQVKYYLSDIKSTFGVYIIMLLSSYKLEIDVAVDVTRLLLYSNSSSTSL